MYLWFHFVRPRAIEHLVRLVVYIYIFSHCKGSIFGANFTQDFYDSFTPAVSNSSAFYWFNFCAAVHLSYIFYNNKIFVSFSMIKSWSFFSCSWYVSFEIVFGFSSNFIFREDVYFCFLPNIFWAKLRRLLICLYIYFSLYFSSDLWRLITFAFILRHLKKNQHQIKNQYNFWAFDQICSFNLTCNFPVRIDFRDWLIYLWIHEYGQIIDFEDMKETLWLLFPFTVYLIKFETLL
jgi:hypothetical protein